jgi:hypothetical protein
MKKDIQIIRTPKKPTEDFSSTINNLISSQLYDLEEVCFWVNGYQIDEIP